MKSKRDTEAPLTPADVQKILSICSPRGLLVGGQASSYSSASPTSPMISPQLVAAVGEQRETLETLVSKQPGAAH